MMQCASCETQITDVAAETGICPKCGMPLPGIGGTMRFSPSLFADLPALATMSPASATDFPADDVALRTLGPAEPDLPQATHTSGPGAAAAEIPAQGTLVVPPEPESPSDTHFRASQAGAADGHDTDRHDTENHDSDINNTIDSRKLSPAEARRYEDTLMGIPDENGTDAGEGSSGEQGGSGTQAVAGVENLSDVREHGDTTLFGPETRLVIQPRALSAPETTAPGGKSPSRLDYELVEVIGRGGMGLVYAARQTSVDREVAVKMIWPDQAQDPSMRENFLSEAVITGELDHPNIVPIHDVGKDSGNALFYSMKRVRGTPWQKVIADTALAENLRILMAVADAVAFAHSRGVVHRDLKPENVMLGDFGEVMVMDWGLAIVTPEFRRADSVSRTIGAGCTPSYAAPELVTGPIGAIGRHSDVYLLGAILYKVLTGKPPHLARTPHECCRAAARNEIEPTTQSGELVDIARKAMASRPPDRFASVQEFQDAIRSYQSHSESLVLSARAGEDLEQARRSGDYQDFARSMFGYQEAIKHWEGNDAARAGLSAARLAYAENALGKEDFDLGLTLVDPTDPAQKRVAARLLAGQSERNQRRRRLKLMYRTAIGLVAVIFIGGSIGLFAINQEKETAKTEKREADEQRKLAVEAQGKERVAKVNAETAQRDAETAERKAVSARDDAVQSEQAAREQRKLAILEKQRADELRVAAVRSQQAQAFEAYVAQIGLASEQINANAFDGALGVLQEQEHSPYRGWEWYRLDYLARQGQTTSAVFGAEVESVALDSAGEQFAAGLRDGRVVIGRLQDLADQKNAKFLAPNHGAAVLAVDFSPDDQFVASAGDSGRLVVWNAADGKRVGPQWTGHAADKPIHSVKFIADDNGRRWLLTASADRTARLWDVSGDPATWKPEAEQILRGHHLQVWDAAMSRDGKRIVTVGEDGRAVVWELAADRRTFVQGVAPPDASGKVRRRVFTGHDGAVYAVAFSHDGMLVASAGLDKRILLWDPQRVMEDNLQDKFSARADPLRGKRSSLQAIALEGHTDPVHSVAFSPDGQYVVSGSDDNTVRIWPRNGDPHGITVLRGHGGWVRSCLFAPRPTETGDWNVISGSHDRRIKLWNVAGYGEVRALRVDRLSDHSDAVLGAAFSPRGDQIVTASRDHVARVWRLSPGRDVPMVVGDSPRKLHEGHDFSVTVAVYLRDGRRIVTSGIDGQVCLWDGQTGAQLGRLPGTGLAAAVAVTPDDQWVLTGSSDATVKLWKIDDVLADYAAGRESAPVHRFEGHEFPVRAIAVSPGGSGVFYSGDNSGSGRLWDLHDREKPARKLPHHTLRVNAAAFTSDGARLLTAADDGDVCLCDGVTGALVKKLEHRAFAASVVALALTPDGRRAISIGEPASENEPFVILDWDVASGELQRKWAFDRGLTVFGVAVSPSPENPLALLSIGIRSSGKTELRGWNLAAWREERATDGRQLLDDLVLSSEHATVWSAAWSPDARRVVTVGGYEAQAWQLDGRRLTMRLGPHRAVAAASFSSDGRFIVTGSWDESFKIWNVEGRATQSLHRIPVSAGGAVNSAVFSPAENSFQILTAHDDGMARLWDWDPKAPEAPPRPIGEFPHPRPVNAAVFSRDGRRILTLCGDGVARVWRAANVRHADLQLKGQHTGPILCGAFSPDGNWIATGGEDKQLVVWNAHTGLPWLESPLQGHSAAINSLAFSDTGDRLVTGSRDNTAKLWDPRTMRPELRDSPPSSDATETAGENGPDATAETKTDVAVAEKLRGKELLTLRGHSGEVTAVAFSPDGRFVLTSGRDNTAILWLTNKP
jgi:WD40 repeat protein